MRDGIVYVTEDRKIEGFFETMSIAENIQQSARRPGSVQALVVRMADMKAMASIGSRRSTSGPSTPTLRSSSSRAATSRRWSSPKSLAQKPKVDHIRRTDPRRRRRHDRRDPSTHQSAGRRRARRRRDLFLPAGDPQYLGPHSRLTGRPHRRGILAQEATEERIMFAAVH